MNLAFLAFERDDAGVGGEARGETAQAPVKIEIIEAADGVPVRRQPDEGGEHKRGAPPRRFCNHWQRLTQQGAESKPPGRQHGGMHLYQ